MFAVAELGTKDLAVYGTLDGLVMGYRTGIIPTEAYIQYISSTNQAVDQEVFRPPMLYPGLRVVTRSETNLLRAVDFFFGTRVEVHYFDSFSSSHS